MSVFETRLLFDLDAVDRKILSYIKDRFTYQEMADALNRSARSGIYRRIERLIRLELVTKSERKSRSRRLTEKGQRVLDTFTSV